MIVFVKTLTGTLRSFQVTSDDTIHVLMRLIHAKDDVPIEQQRLIFAGRQLEEERTLADYHIQHESMIHMALRLRGGMLTHSSGRIAANETPKGIPLVNDLGIRLHSTKRLVESDAAGTRKRARDDATQTSDQSE